MKQHEHPELSITQQCKLIHLSRSAFYYAPVGMDADMLSMMTESNRIFTHTRSSDHAKSQPICIGKELSLAFTASDIPWQNAPGDDLQVALGHPSASPAPRLPVPGEENADKSPKSGAPAGLIRCMALTDGRRADISFVPVRNGVPYLVAIMDRATRRVSSWRLYNTKRADFCIEALIEPIARHGLSKAMNTPSPP